MSVILVSADGAQLLACDRTGRAAVGRARALLHAGRFAQQVGRRRRLEHERERAIREDRDLDRDDAAGLRRGPLVVLFHEPHNIDAVAAKRWADGRRWGRFAGRQLELNDSSNFLCHDLLLISLVDSRSQAYSAAQTFPIMGRGGTLPHAPIQGSPEIISGKPNY